MALTFDAPPGATPLDADEAIGLIPKGIATRGQLDEYESANIAQALTWAERKRRDVLSEKFLTELHKRMFGRVWRWAGKYRTSGKNIGIAPQDIAPAIRDLVEDVNAQIAAAQLPAAEIAVRFHHRMTRIHPFANGNGRHARLATDILLEQLGEPRFSWGAGNLQHAGAARDKYIGALHAADGGDYRPLTEFLRDRAVDAEDAHERK